MGIRDSPLDAGAALRALEARVRRLESANPLQRGTVDSGGQVRVAPGAHLEVEGTAQFQRVDAAISVNTEGWLRAEEGINSLGNLIIGESGANPGDNQVAFHGVDEMTTHQSTRALALAPNGVVVSVPWPQTSGGGDPGPGGTTFMPPFAWSTVTSEYGPRDIPGTSPFHRGIDFGIYPAVEGATIVAAGSGVVSSVSLHSDAGPYGLEINHGPASDGKNIRTQYWHNNSRLVNLGDTVAKGQAIATVGNLGNSRGAHLHWECHVDGAHMNPRDFIAQYANG